MFSHKTFELLGALAANNNKPWFEANRGELDRHVYVPFERNLEAISEQLAGSKIPLQGSKRTMYKINRDLRFTPDKTLYKTAVSGVLTASGTKTSNYGIVFVSLDPDGGELAGGYYQLRPDNLKPIRDRIVRNPDSFKGMLDALKSAGRALAMEDALTAMPRGYAEHADAWYANYLKLQSLVAREAVPKSVWKRGEVAERAARFTTDCAPLIQFA